MFFVSNPNGIEGTLNPGSAVHRQETVHRVEGRRRIKPPLRD